MANFPYNSNVPNPPDNPSADVGDMQTNSGSIANIIAVDHIGFNLNNGGWHTILHQPNNANGGPAIGGQTAWNPVVGSAGRNAVQAANIPGVQQTFTLNWTPQFGGGPGTTDTQLFTMTGNGGVSQLSGNNAITNGGWQWIGGTLLIWGNVSTDFFAAPVSITFTTVSGTTIAFPNSIFQVYTSMNGTSSTANLVEITALSATGFSWKFTGGSGTHTSFTGFSWLAIGF
jgi:hypothetical protein